MTNTKMVTSWTTKDGYGRIAMPNPVRLYDEACQKEEHITCDNARDASGWESFDDQFENSDSLAINAYVHVETGWCSVEVWGGHRGISFIYIAPDDAGVFFATEYLVMVARAKAAQQADDTEKLQKAVLSFVRHGHGLETISEFGQTKDEAFRRIRNRTAKS